MTEKWRNVVGYEGIYEVSDRGRVRSLDRTIIQTIRGRAIPARWRGRELAQSVKRDGADKGHLVVTLSDTPNGRRLVSEVGNLVLLAFVGPCPPEMECCHTNDDGHDNRLANLRWGTRSDNVRDQVINGRHNWLAENRYGR